jgi:hypothetical protein
MATAAERAAERLAKTDRTLDKASSSDKTPAEKIRDAIRGR